MTRAALFRLWTRLGIPADYASRARTRVQREARSLVFIGRAADDRRRLRLAPGAARAWRRMQAAAAADGVDLVPLSAYRSVARQTLIVRRKLARGQSIAAILRVNAIPGCSEHHTGRALDLGTTSHLQLEPSFARTKAFHWLRQNAGRHEFTMTYGRRNPFGISYEPWHWCWRGNRSARGRKVSY